MNIVVNTDAMDVARVIDVDSITQLDASTAHDSVVLAASHGGRYSAHAALAVGVRAAIFHDAGVGLERAGVAGLELLQSHDVPGAAVAASSARIGSADQMRRCGRIAHTNDAAHRLGCLVGMAADEAADILRAARPGRSIVNPARESRSPLLVDSPVAVWALDSASLVRAADAGSVVVTGSHGQLLGDDPATALKVDSIGAVFNDAGIGRDGPSGRLGVLAEHGVPAVTVGADTARIGDGRSTYFDGVISRVNAPAAALGATVGMRCRAFVDLAVQSVPRPLDATQEGPR